LSRMFKVCKIAGFLHICLSYLSVLLFSICNVGNISATWMLLFAEVPRLLLVPVVEIAL
jgi:hypothetical protein